MYDDCVTDHAKVTLSGSEGPLELLTKKAIIDLLKQRLKKDR